MERVVQTILRTFSRRLGDQLEAVYLCADPTQGLYQPDKSARAVLIVVSDGTSIHALRTLFQPFWSQYEEAMQRGPLVARRSSFLRHMKLYPMLARHLALEAQQLLGAPDLLDDLAQIHPLAGLAHLALEAMEVSAALAPETLEPATTAASLNRLRRLARHLHGSSVKEEETAAQLFARVQYALSQAARQAPAVRSWTGMVPQLSTPGLLPGLQATYKELDRVTLVFADLPPQQIVTTNWQQVAQRAASQGSGMYVTTATQLRLIVELERPLDLLFRRYRHEWGNDPLAGVKSDSQYIFRHAARLPSEIEVDLLPAAYLTDNDSQLHRLIHDFQNKLLNVQLEHELLCRFQGIERFVPSPPLPERTAPTTQRIEALFQYLALWSDYYTGLMAQPER